MNFTGFLYLWYILMKVHLIKELTLRNFTLANARSKSSIETWLAIIRYADWDKPSDIQNTFGSADLLGNNSNRVIFNIGGNNYRMICKYHFGNKQAHLFVCWIGTHAEYDLLCSKELQYTINHY